MHVAQLAEPVVQAVVDHATAAERLGHSRIVLLAGPAGFGKTSVLAAAAPAVADRLGARLVWISGGVIASEAHLASLLAPEVMEAGGGPTLEAAMVTVGPPHRVILAVDDVDSLLFKRERLAAQLAAHCPLCLVGSCNPSAAARFASPGHAFADVMSASGDAVRVVEIEPFGEAEARALIKRRAPRLLPEDFSSITAAAGGHPAALVFLSRVAEMRLGSGSPTGAGLQVPSRTETEYSRRELLDLVEWAAEFAGAVYAESWAGLGPQQRAILWQLTRAHGPTSASVIAEALRLPPSHVSAQITRLVSDGLVQRTGIRGQLTVAPLLARWITRRAARTDSSADSMRTLPTGDWLRQKEE